MKLILDGAPPPAAIARKILFAIFVILVFKVSDLQVSADFLWKPESSSSPFSSLSTEKRTWSSLQYHTPTRNYLNPRDHRFLWPGMMQDDDDYDKEEDEEEQQQQQEEEEEGKILSLLHKRKKSLLARRGTTLTSVTAATTSTTTSSSEEDDFYFTDQDEPERLDLTLLVGTMRGGAGGTSGSKQAQKLRHKNDNDTTASMTSSVFNLVNNVAGAGILALSAGMSGGTGYIPAIGTCIVLGLLSSYSFRIIGIACELTNERDFKGLWATTMSPETTYLVDIIIAILCIACSIIYSGILGDVFPPLLDKLNIIPQQYNTRTSNIVTITVLFLLPLSLIKNLSALAFTSILGFCAIVYTVIFVVIRAIDGSYRLGSGKFVELITTEGNPGAGVLMEALPSFERTSTWGFGFTSLVLASNLGLAFIAHYNSPTFYRQLRNTNSSRFAKMVNISFTILVVLYITTMLAGYSTFGDASRGNLLLNYHPHDGLSTLGRLATGCSILFGFPLVMCGARESLIGAISSIDCRGLESSIGNERYHFLLVASMLLFVTAISCLVEDVSLVVGLTGAALGSFIVYICPPLLYTSAVKVVKGETSDEYKNARLSLALVPFGIFVGSLGVYMTFKESGLV